MILMGMSNSRDNSNSNMSGLSDSDDDLDGINPTRHSHAGEDGQDGDFPALVAFLIRSGQVRIINDGRAYSDDDSSDDYEDFVVKCKPAPVYKNPDTSVLKQSDIHADVMQSSGHISDPRWTYYFRPTFLNRIAKRQIGLNSQKQFTHGDRCIISSNFLPNKMTQLASYNHKVFCGTYSADGNLFVTVCQDQNIRVYNTRNDRFDLIRTIRAKDVGWSVLDTAFSPDGRYAAYSSWSECIHLCNLYGDYDVHEALPLNPGDYSFCIFSLKFSSDNKEILGGANDGCLYVYDREADKRTLKIEAHDDDVNAVSFADQSSQILYSGGDDGLCKIWDRRTLHEKNPQPVGTLSGHSDGVVYIDSKGDARYLISNSKDQTMRLWDVRHLSDQAGIEETKRAVSSQKWDYRWQQVPRKVLRTKPVKGDCSVMTYRGHRILNTLIRCKFSPTENTGQRYLITGCASGRLVVYDILTGEMVTKLDGHRSCIRDVTWHPYNNTIITSSWDYTLGKWTYNSGEEEISPRDPVETVSDDETPRSRRLRNRLR